MGEALDAILPEGAVGVERGSLDGAGVVLPVPELHPAEEELVTGASERRRREFAEARRCAREALEALGVPAGPILATRDGAPVWPEGVVGSITHKDGYCAAVVGRAAELTGLGIDAEPDQWMPKGVLETIASPGELRQVEALLDRQPDLAWDRLLFSAKEATVKAAHRLGLAVAGVRTVEVSFDPDARSFTGILARADAASMNGAWARKAGLLVTLASNN